ncbi:MAG TPA: exo-beta-N-acetylmuramidase NamZ domain-containing protein [Bryobacteraceae bacterium]|nr:exo-beta-N-acetylmuramidase NamZ domain-containing protein [Bryobacteraceae bacterium]
MKTNLRFSGIASGLIWGLALVCLPAVADANHLASLPRLSGVDSIIQQAVADGNIPGAVLVVGHNGAVVYRKAYGNRALEPRREPMTLDTVFDLASLTKVIATTTAVMQLVELGKVRMNDPVAKYLPEFAQNGKEDITVRQLLTHYSGLAPDLDLTTPWEGKNTAYQLAFVEPPETVPGSGFVYSDINFIMLGALVERVSGETLDAYTTQHIFVPLKMTRTRFVPPAVWRAKIAPTQYDENEHMLRGVVHDPTARRMGGVAGHAGLFSTGDDLAKFAQTLLNGGDGILSALTVEKMTSPETPPAAPVLRGFGWDIDSPFSSNRGDLLPVGSYGHTGWTGTSVWIDPTTQSYIILLTNAVHPRGKGNAIGLRSKVATEVAAALNLTASEKEALRWKSITGYNEAFSAARRMGSRNGTVKNGIDVLEDHGFDVLKLTGPSSEAQSVDAKNADAKNPDAKSIDSKNQDSKDQDAKDLDATKPETQNPGPKKRIGLVTNQTGIDSQGVRTIDVLAKAPGVSLDAIFSPEHGVTGTLDTTDINNSKDAATGIPVYSVYGGTDAARRPPAEVMKNLDAVVFDIQDAGVRFYTYETTLGYFLEAAAQAGVELIVLDRPNPITGSFVQGPVADAGRETFTNYWTVPVRHGMTIGELAKMFNAERNINAKLTVVPMDGWQRGDWFDSTGLAWVNPSPNLRSVTEAALYPGVALIEGTNVSVGRGTDTPFELVGAPWIKSKELAAYLNARGIAGVRFVPVTFTPTASVHNGQACSGVNIILTDRNGFDAPELGIELAAALHKLYVADFKLEHMLSLLVNQTAYDALVAGQDPRRIAQEWQEGLEKFQKIREKYLIYK